MLKRKIAIASLMAFVTLPALAEDAPKAAEAPKAPYTLSANIFLADVKDLAHGGGYITIGRTF